MDRTRADRREDHLPQFPLRLLVVGYGTGGIAGLSIFLAGGGWLQAGLTFWLGGAIATLAWGAGQVFLCKQLRRQSRRASTEAVTPAE